MMYKMPEIEEADMNALCIYNDLENYIETMGGRFFFNADNESGKLFFDELKNNYQILRKRILREKHTTEHELFNAKQDLIQLVKMVSTLFQKTNLVHLQAGNQVMEELTPEEYHICI